MLNNRWGTICTPTKKAIDKKNQMVQPNEEQRENIRKYLRFLHDEDGWSDLIDSRWKDEVKDVLTKNFPEMTDNEWNVLESFLFI